LDLGSLKDVDPQTIQEQIQGAAEMRTLYISGGRKEKVRPGDILGALTGEAGRLSAADVGKIEIHDHFSYVAVSAHLADTALERLRNGRIKGRKFKVEAVR
jgi:ATP-independent RNA helicase DbpA